MWGFLPMAEPGDKPLSIAVIGRHAPLSGWAALLREDGVPFRTYASAEQAEPAPDLAVFLAGSGIAPDDWKSTPAIFDQQCPPGAEIHALAWAERVYHKKGVGFFAPFRGWAVGWSGKTLGNFILAREGESPQYPVACFDGKNTFVVGDISDSLASRGYCFRPVCSGPSGEIHQIHPPSERERAQRFLREVLSSAMNRAGLPAVRLSPYPPGHPVPFIFRVDVDYLMDPVMMPIRKWASRLGWKITAFVNVSGEEAWEDGNESMLLGTCRPAENLNWLWEFQKEGHEVACHGFRHNVWPDYGTVVTDLKKAKAVLEGIVNERILGYSAPGGVWHPLVGMAAGSLGFVYTTEASLAYGGNPFFPGMGCAGNCPMQVPCSPLYPAHHTLGENAEPSFLGVFQSLAREAAENLEPVSFMGHPFDLEGASPVLWEGIAKVVASLGCKPTTMAQVSQLAIRRKNLKLGIYKSGNDWFATADEQWELMVNGRPVLIGPDAKLIGPSAT